MAPSSKLLSISAGILSIPEALLFFSSFIAALTSSTSTSGPMSSSFLGISSSTSWLSCISLSSLLYSSSTYSFQRFLTSFDSFKILPGLSLTSIPPPFPGFLDRRFTSSYTLSYLPIRCKSSNSLHFSFHHFSLASSVVLRNLLFNLLYSCLALSVLWCFHFIRSSISSTISFVIHGFLAGILSSAPTISMALSMMLSFNLFHLSSMELPSDSVRFSSIFLPSSLLLSFRFLLFYLCFIVFPLKKFKFYLGPHDDQVVICFCICSWHCFCILDNVSVPLFYQNVIQLESCHISWSLLCIPPSFLMLKPGICYYQFSSVAELCQFFASVISPSQTILSNAFSVCSFSHNRVPISHYHYIICSLGSIQYFFQPLIHILYFFLFVICCWHVDLYNHYIDWFCLYFNLNYPAST